MKFLLSILMILAMFVNSISAQDKTITVDQAYTVKGGTADTIKGASGTNTYTLYINSFCTDFKIGIKQTKVSGTYSEGHYTVYSSIDNSNWTSIAALNLHASTTTSARYVETSLLTPWTPYVKVVAAGGDSTGNQRIQYFIVVKKN